PRRLFRALRGEFFRPDPPFPIFWVRREHFVRPPPLTAQRCRHRSRIPKMRTVFNCRPLALLLGAALFLPADAQKPNEFIVPPAVSANEPFTFAVSGVVEGEVVD